MTKQEFCYLYLTCENTVEAAEIAEVLLGKHLVACVKQVPVESSFHWKGQIEDSKEILLLMQSRLDLFQKIEKEVAKLHSYETFVLEAVPIVRISKKAQQWLKKELLDV